MSYDDNIEILDVPTPSPELLEAGQEELIHSVRKMKIQAHLNPIEKSGENGLQENLDIDDPLIGAGFKDTPVNGLLMQNVHL